jgi:hypothetical protein
MNANIQPAYRDFPDGDLRRSQTEIDKTKRMLGCAIWHKLAEVIAKVSHILQHKSNYESHLHRCPL